MVLKVVIALLFLSLVCYAAPPTAFSANATWNENGVTYSTFIAYSSSQSLMSVTYLFPTSQVQEIYDYNGNQISQICPTGNCSTSFTQSHVWNLYLASGYVSQGADTVDSVACTKYSVPQPDGFSSTLWFANSNNYIVRAVLSSSTVNYQLDFTNVVASVSGNAFTPSKTCSPLTCYSQLDICLILDDSGSINDADWLQAVSFARNVVSSFNVESDGTHIAIVTFSSTAIINSALSGDPIALNNTLNNLVEAKGETYLSAALGLAQNGTLSNGRAGVPKAIILVTDGQPNIPAATAVSDAFNAAAYSRSQGTIIYAIGVGAQINLATLQGVASPNSTQFSYVGQVSDFTNLASLRNTLVSAICSGGVQTSACSNPTCDASQGFCACGTCLCTQDCSLLTSGCNQGVCGSNGVCTTTKIPGCCDLTSANCHGHGNPDLTACAVTPQSPCTCDSNYNCGNGGSVAYDCSCNCVGNYGTSSDGTCDQCNLNCNYGTANSDCATCTCSNSAVWGGALCNQCERSTNCGYGTLNTQSCTCQCSQNYYVQDPSSGSCVCSPSAASTGLCNGRGTSSDCSSCSCNACKNGGINDATCSCTTGCQSPWQYNQQTHDCDSCSRDNSYCNNRGTLNTQDCQTCTCNAPWSGPTCTQCNPFSCAHGSFDNNACQCDCPSGTDWAGGDCSSCNWPCSHGGTANATCNGCDNCQATWTGTNCQTCTRSPSECKNGGTLNTGTCLCNCVAGWGGDDCTTCTYTPSNHCNNNGNVTATCNGCTCSASYWSGSTCNNCTRPAGFCGTGTVNTGDCKTCICPAGSQFTVASNCLTCALNATSCVNGKFNKTTCKCDCLSGWSGEFCSVCSNSASNCKGQSTWNATLCACNCPSTTFYQGVYCDTCPPTANCGLGELIPTSGCQCFCNSFVNKTGRLCDQCYAGNGFCSGNGLINNSICACKCEGSWSGETCSLCPLSQATCPGSSLLNSTGCNCHCPLTAKNCTGHRVVNNTQCKCICPAPWSGANCTVCNTTALPCALADINNATCSCLAAVGDIQSKKTQTAIIAGVVSAAAVLLAAALGVVVFLALKKRRPAPEPVNALSMDVQDRAKIDTSPLYKGDHESESPVYRG